MLKWIFGLLTSMLLVIVMMFGKLAISNSHNEDKENNIEYNHHIQAVIQENDGYFWTLFKEGANKAGEEYATYIEYIQSSKKDLKVLDEIMEKAINSKIEGIILQAFDVNTTRNIIENAKNEGVSILTYENDNSLIPETPIVGSNSFSIGRLAGSIAIRAIEGKANVAVILNDSSQDLDIQYKDLIVQGIIESFSESEEMNLYSVHSINSEIFEVEKIATNIITNNNIDVIICIDEKSTPGIAQALVDNNKVGDIKLIGYGVMPQTLKYIENEVIYASICPDPYEIGYNSVKQLVKHLEGEQISDYISTTIYEVNKSNTSNFK